MGSEDPGLSEEQVKQRDLYCKDREKKEAFLWTREDSKVDPSCRPGFPPFKPARSRGRRI